jgi:hypothetical protein
MPVKDGRVKIPRSFDIVGVDCKMTNVIAHDGSSPGYPYADFDFSIFGSLSIE